MAFDFSEEAKQTNEKFAVEIARLTKLTDRDIKRLFPKKADKERLLELMQIVRSAATRNQKVAKLRENIATLGESVIRLLEIAA